MILGYHRRLIAFWIRHLAQFHRALKYQLPFLGELLRVWLLYSFGMFLWSTNVLLEGEYQRLVLSTLLCFCVVCQVASLILTSRAGPLVVDIFAIDHVRFGMYRLYLYSVLTFAMLLNQWAFLGQTNATDLKGDRPIEVPDLEQGVSKSGSTRSILRNGATWSPRTNRVIGRVSFHGVPPQTLDLVRPRNVVESQQFAENLVDVME